MLELNITGQRLTRTDNTFVVADSVNYLKAHFTVSNDWTGVITTVWGHDGEYYAMVLDENKECVIPWEVIKSGIMVVSAFCGNLVTANVLSINVTASGYVDGAVPEEPTEEVYNQIIELINGLQADIDAIELNNLTLEDVQDLIDTSLTSYSTTSQMNQAIADATSSFQDATEVNSLIDTALEDYSTTEEMNQAISTAVSELGAVETVNNIEPTDGNVNIDADDIPETATNKYAKNVGSFPNMIDDYNMKSPYGYWNLGYRNDTIQCDVRDNYTKFTSSHAGEKYIYDTFTVQNGHKYLLLMSYRILSSNNTVQLRLGVDTPPYYLAGNTSIPIVAEFAQTGYIYDHSSASVSGFFQIIDTSSNALDMDIEYCVLLDITGIDTTFNDFRTKYITGIESLQENVIYAGEIPKINYLMDKVLEQEESYYIAKNSNIFDKNFISTNGTKMEDENGTEFVMKSMGFYNNVGYIATDSYSSPLGSTNGIIETHNEDTYRELSALGFNSVRFYMTYEWFEDADSPVIDPTLAGDPTDYKQEAWDFLDAEIEMARRHNIRLCLNMHVYQGLGGKEDVDLWTDSDTQTRLINLWKAIARKYSNEDFILGFGLINEPNITWNTSEANTIARYQTLSNSIVTEIRKVDTNHIIFSECAIAGVLGDGSKVFTLNSNLNFISVLNDGVEDTNYVYECHHYQPIALSHNASDYSHPSMVYPNDLALYSWDGTYTYVNTKSGNRTIASGGADETTYTAITTGIITPDTGVNFIFPFVNIYNAGGGEIIDIDNFKVKIYDASNNEVFIAFEDDCQNGAIFTTKANYWTVALVTGSGDGDTKFLRLTALNELNSNTSYSAMTDIGDGGVALAKRFIIPDGYKYSVECKVKITNVQVDHNVTFVVGCDEISTPYQFAYNIQLHEKLLYDYKAFTDNADVPLFVGEFGTRDDSYTKGGDLWVHDAIKVFLDYKVGHNYHDYNEPFTGNTFSFYEQLHDERFKNKRLEYIFKQCYLADLTAEEVTKIYQEVYGGN
jgi:endoglucanase